MAIFLAMSIGSWTKQKKQPDFYDFFRFLKYLKLASRKFAVVWCILVWYSEKVT